LTNHIGETGDAPIVGVGLDGNAPAGAVGVGVKLGWIDCVGVGVTRIRPFSTPVVTFDGSEPSLRFTIHQLKPAALATG
jgi:hypothetical protein